MSTTMSLTEAARIIPMDVERPADFASLGFITHASPQRLIFVESEKFLAKLAGNTLVSAVITTPEFAPRIPAEYGLAVCAEPRRVFYTLHNYLVEHTEFFWKSFPSKIAKTATIHSTAYVAPSDVVIEDGAIIEPHAMILEKSVIGQESVIRTQATIGVESFEFERLGDEILHVIHAGGARLGKRVEIQAKSNVDRAVFGGFTEVGDDTKLGALVHIGHTSVIGKRVLISVLTVISGSVRVGDDVWIGPGCAISSELVIGDKAYVTIGSVVTRNVEPGQHVSGNFAIDHEKYLAFIKSIR